MDAQAEPLSVVTNRLIEHLVSVGGHREFIEGERSQLASALCDYGKPCCAKAEGALILLYYHHLDKAFTIEPASVSCTHGLMSGQCVNPRNNRK